MRLICFVIHGAPHQTLLLLLQFGLALAPVLLLGSILRLVESDNLGRRELIYLHSLEASRMDATLKARTLSIHINGASRWYLDSLLILMMQFDVIAAAAIRRRAYLGCLDAA